MSLFTTLFGDPTIKLLQKYKKDLEKIKKIETEYRDTVTSFDAVQLKTREFRERFTPLRTTYLENKNQLDQTQGMSIEDKNERRQQIEKQYTQTREEMIQSLRFEALALHRRASELIYGQTYTLSDGTEKAWNMIPFDVQLIGALTLNG